MNIEHADSHPDAERHQDHREQQILPQQRDGQRRRRDDLGQQQEEHSQGEEDRYAQSNLKSPSDMMTP